MNSTKFPSIHIAESVFNRIMNIHDELFRDVVPPPTVPQGGDPAPNMGTTLVEGTEINDALATPVAPVAPTADQTGALGGVASGTNLIDTMV